jgi:hypothetical protein
LYCAENWTRRKADHKYLENFDMWCCSRKEKISWTDRMKNEILHIVKEEKDILHTTKRKKANGIGHSLRRICLLKHITKGKIEGRGRRGRRRKNLVYNLKETRRYWTLKEEALHYTFWST